MADLLFIFTSILFKWFFATKVLLGKCDCSYFFEYAWLVIYCYVFFKCKLQFYLVIESDIFFSKTQKCHLLWFDGRGHLVFTLINFFCKEPFKKSLLWSFVFQKMIASPAQVYLLKLHKLTSNYLQGTLEYISILTTWKSSSKQYH